MQRCGVLKMQLQTRFSGIKPHAKGAVRVIQATFGDKNGGIKHTAQAGRAQLSMRFRWCERGPPVHLQLSGTVIVLTLSGGSSCF